MNKPQKYRNIIDSLVNMCHSGQGSIGAERVIHGIWNQNATESNLVDQYEINQLLAKLSMNDRKKFRKCCHKK